MVRYPAILIYDKESEVYNVFFPDVYGAVSFGKSIEEAIVNAKDCLSLCLSGVDERDLPIASDINKLKEEYQHVEIIEV